LEGGSPKEIIHLEDLGLDRRIKLKQILKKEGGRTWIDFIWLGIEERGGLS
jgi:hypothetical protein